MHQTSIEGVDDMANLADLHDAAILHNINVRYIADKIYVSLYWWFVLIVSQSFDWMCSCI